MISVKGIGWINQNKYGSVLQNLCRDYNPKESLHSQLRDESVFLYPVKNFGRFDEVSKRACCIAALALQDAKISYPRGNKEDVGIIGTNRKGCLQSNLNYFKDYVQAGRVSGRGNLFIYTLPSSPLAEIAICFGFRGPLLYINFPEKQIFSVLRYAKMIIDFRETSLMLVLHVDESEGVCFVIGQENNRPTDDRYCLDRVIAFAEKTLSQDELITKITKSVC